MPSNPPIPFLWAGINTLTQYFCIVKGDEVVEGRALNVSTCALTLTSDDTGDWHSMETLWYSDVAIPPASRLDPSVKKLCSITYSIPYREIRKIPTYISAGKTCRDVYFSRDIICGGASLEYRVTYNGRLVACVNFEYIDDF